MRVLRVEAEGLTTSFRYPHFLVGRQPTFRMPPPATIYGHICSAVGDFVDPADVSFAYIFTHAGIVDDLELLHMATVGTGRMPNDRALPKNLDVTTNPVPREVLVFPRLTLYLHAPGQVDRLLAAFREPRYMVVLGRSQDLMGYRRVETIDLHEADAAYFEATLLPWSYRSRTRAGIGVTMPRFIDPRDRRRVIWSPFVMLEDRVRLANVDETGELGKQVLARATPNERVWIDPEAPAERALRRGVIWHSFLGTSEDGPHFLSPAG